MPANERGKWSSLALAAGVHIALGMFLFYGVRWQNRLPDAVEVELVSAPLPAAVVVREPVGVIGMITPWNWPLNQIACKVAPALAAGCTMILKPSEFTPTSALIFAEIMEEAGTPAS